MEVNIEQMITEDDELIVPMSIEYREDITADDFRELCRLCGNRTNQLMPIFAGDGLEHDLSGKIKEYLPISVSFDDDLPSKICYQCASTLISWHELYYACKEADQRLKELSSRLCKVEKTAESFEDVFEEKYDYGEDVTDSIFAPGEIQSDDIDDNTSEGRFMKIVEPPQPTDSNDRSIQENASESTHTTCPSCKKRVTNSEKFDPFCRMCATKNEQSKSLSDPRVPKQFEHFFRMHSNGIKYMQCDRCSFICRPLAQLFLKHYREHSTDGDCSPLMDNAEDESTENQCDPNDNQKKEKVLYKPLEVQEKKIFECESCARKFKTKLSFDSHVRRHAQRQIKVVTLRCDLCEKTFRSKDGYKYHKLNKCTQYACELCDERFLSKKILSQHVSKEHGTTVNDERTSTEAPKSMCFVCGKIIKDVNMERHMKVVHTEEKPFVCDMCGKKFKFKSALRDHILKKLDVRDHVCEICGREFVKRSYLNKHVRFHFVNAADAPISNRRVKKLGHEGFQSLECDLCGRDYPSKELLHKHLQREVICSLCDELFSSSEMLKQHVLAVHTLDEYRKRVNKNDSGQPGSPEISLVYPCELCGRRFTNEERYQQHRMMETRCDLCDEAFGDQSELRTHVNDVHSLIEYRKVVSLRWRKRIRPGGIKSKEYTCQLCGKKLFYKRTLSLHMRMHSGLKPYKCEYCGKAYTSKHSLNSHLATELNLRKFECVYCGKRYNFNADLVVHLKQRHETRQFSCHVCGKEFGLLKYLKDHLSIHTQERPFHCDRCNLDFRLRKFLLKHNRKYHSGDNAYQCIEVSVTTSTDEIENQEAEVNAAIDNIISNGS